jgi:hypothetical protein
MCSFAVPDLDPDFDPIGFAAADAPGPAAERRIMLRAPATCSFQIAFVRAA